LWAALTGRSVLVALAFGALGGLAISPTFATPLPIVLARTLTLSLVLLVVYVVAGYWPERWLPRWLPRGVVQLLMIGLATPLATLALYVVTVAGSVSRVLHSPWTFTGFLLIAGTGVFLGLLIATIALLRERDAQAHAQALRFALERSQLERQALDARLSLLQAQIEPHFLFNTLANVQALVEQGSPRAPEVLRSLIAYLRAAMPRLHDGRPTVGAEVELVRAYLELMRMRMPDRLHFEIDVDPTLRACRLPPMALLTLVENAVRHGIDPVEDGGSIEVGGRATADGGMRLWVADTGAGMADSAQPGTGLNNLRDRLHAQYGQGAELQWTEVEPHGLRAEIVIPAEAEP
jgi:sensor histidine kinase YesM